MPVWPRDGENRSILGTGVASAFQSEHNQIRRTRLEPICGVHVAKCLDFAVKDESSFDRSREKLLLCVGSLLGRMKLKLPGKIETNVPKARPLIGIATRHALLMERTFFLERLQQALASECEARRTGSRLEEDMPLSYDASTQDCRV